MTLKLQRLCRTPAMESSLSQHIVATYNNVLKNCFYQSAKDKFHIPVCLILTGPVHPEKHSGSQNLHNLFPSLYSLGSWSHESIHMLLLLSILSVRHDRHLLGPLPQHPLSEQLLSQTRPSESEKGGNSLMHASIPVTNIPI